MTSFLTRLVTAVGGDGSTLAAMSALLLATAFAATYLTARRASQVEQIVALRCQ